MRRGGAQIICQYLEEVDLGNRRGLRALGTLGSGGQQEACQGWVVRSNCVFPSGCVNDGAGSLYFYM